MSQNVMQICNQLSCRIATSNTRAGWICANLACPYKWLTGEDLPKEDAMQRKPRYPVVDAKNMRMRATPQSNIETHDKDTWWQKHCSDARRTNGSCCTCHCIEEGAVETRKDDFCARVEVAVRNIATHSRSCPVPSVRQVAGGQMQQDDHG